MKKSLFSLIFLTTIYAYTLNLSAETTSITEAQIKLIYPDKRPDIELKVLGETIIETGEVSDFRGPLFEIYNQEAPLLSLANYIIINKDGEIKHLNISRNDLYNLDNINKLKALESLAILNGGVQSAKLSPPLQP